jgi:amidase
MGEIALGTATASEAVALLASGELGSEELLDAQLARIARFDGDVNAVVALDVERARARCRDADRARAGGTSWGPLHGLPITIKDSYETEGLVTTSGAPELAGHVPTVDADGVELLKRAGVIVFGKTNLPLYAGDLQTFNDVHGLTRNPWNLDRTVGGSTGGGAAAVAAGFSLLELGSDIGGSIRCPAHYCGVYGIKPSWWVVSKRGHIPGRPGARSHLDLTVAGPLGRSVDDLELAMEVLTADGVHGLPGARLPDPSPTVADLRGCRVGVWLDDPHAVLGHEVRDAIERLAAELEAAGATILTDVRPATPTDRWFALYYLLLLAKMSADLDEETRDFMATIAEGVPLDVADPMLAAARGATVSHAEWLGLEERRFQFMHEWDGVFEQVDVMLAPPAPVPAFPHDQTPMAQRTLEVDGVLVPAIEHLVWAALATLPYLPGTVVPIARSAEGLPIGVQIVGPRWADRTTLAFARHVEQIAGGFVAPPGYA